MDADSQAMAKLLQGWVAGTLQASKRQENMPLNIVKVDVPADEQGNFKDYIEVTLFSGRKLHVLFTSFDPGEETT